MMYQGAIYQETVTYDRPLARKATQAMSRHVWAGSRPALLAMNGLGLSRWVLTGRPCGESGVLMATVFLMLPLIALGSWLAGRQRSLVEVGAWGTVTLTFSPGGLHRRGAEVLQTLWSKVSQVWCFSEVWLLAADRGAQPGQGTIVVLPTRQISADALALVLRQVQQRGGSLHLQSGASRALARSTVEMA